jgi:hypothetical protein
MTCKDIVRLTGQEVFHTFPDCLQHPPLKGKPVPKSVCTTANCLYTVQCLMCEDYYIGETRRAFRKRALEHRPAGNDWNRDLEKLSGVRIHNLKCHAGKASFLPMIIQVLHQDTPDNIRKDKEKKIIMKYRPAINILHQRVLQEKRDREFPALSGYNSPSSVTSKKACRVLAAETVRGAPSQRVLPGVQGDVIRPSDTASKTVCRAQGSSTASASTKASRRARIRGRQSSPAHIN